MSGPYDWQADGVGYSVRCDRRGVPELFATLPGHADELLPAVLEELLSLAERWGEAERERASWEAKATALKVEDGLRTVKGLLEEPRLEEWMPLASAPRDGTRILVDFGRIGVHAVAWEEPANLESPTWCVDDCKHGPYMLRGYLEEEIRAWRGLPERGRGHAPERWIPVEERLPDSGRNVLVWSDEAVRVAYHDDRWSQPRVTRWRELPEGPA